MKKMIFASLLSMMMTLPAIATAGEGLPQSKEVMVGVNDAFIPSGFDSETDAYVVVSGYFPNGCYRWSRVEIESKDAVTHEIKSFANVSQGMCLMVIVPFTKEVRLGKLQAGDHTLRFVNGDGTYLEKTLSIEE